MDSNIDKNMLNLNKDLYKINQFIEELRDILYGKWASISNTIKNPLFSEKELESINNNITKSFNEKNDELYDILNEIRFCDNMGYDDKYNSYIHIKDMVIKWINKI